MELAGACLLFRASLRNAFLHSAHSKFPLKKSYLKNPESLPLSRELRKLKLNGSLFFSLVNQMIHLIFGDSLKSSLLRVVVLYLLTF